MTRKQFERFLPIPVKAVLSRLRRRYRRYAWAKRVLRDEDARVPRAELIPALRSLGVRQGRDLIIHSSLSSIGLVEGGPIALIESLREVIGPDATLLMPTYYIRGNMLMTMLDPSPFDVRESPSSMGRITEVFRQLPGVMRSGHPTHSVSALGPGAESYVAHHHLSGSPAGPGSPFRLLSERKGFILCLGVGVGKVTSHHVIEDLVSDFPLDVYLPEMMHKLVIFADGSRCEVSTRVHNPRYQPVRIDNHQGMRDEILEEMKTRGMVKEGCLGRAEAQLFGAAEIDELHRSRLAAGKHTIYAIPRSEPSMSVTSEPEKSRQRRLL